jgi:sugar O-acyltransferase (sialic acid O-acetyltransferase NeuD family)
MVNNVVVVGAGGHSRVLLSILRSYKNFKVIGIADRDSKNIGEEISGTAIKHSWNDFREIYERGTRHAVIALGDNKERKELFTRLSSIGFKIPSIIHPSAIIEKDAVLGNGCVICMGVKIGTLVSIGKNCVVYTGSIIDHEVKIGNHVYISPGCNIAGRVTIGEGSFVGIGSNIKEKITVGKNAVIGAGSVVIRDIGDNLTVAGVPAKTIR